MPTVRRRTSELLRPRGSTAILAVGPTGILPVDLFFRYIVDILRYFKLKAVSFKLIKNNRQSGSDHGF
jgi:hypothetical protein